MAGKRKWRKSGAWGDPGAGANPGPKIAPRPGRALRHAAHFAPPVILIAALGVILGGLLFGDPGRMNDGKGTAGDPRVTMERQEAGGPTRDAAPWGAEGAAGPKVTADRAEMTDPLAGTMLGTGVDAAGHAGTGVPGGGAAGAPRIALVIDDLGNNRPRSDRAAQLPGTVTLAFLPYAPRVQEQAKAALRAGHEILVHMPMEPAEANLDPGPNALERRLTDREFQRRLRRNLSAFEGYRGINNHMGSALTRDPGAMAKVFAELARRDLYFFDSRTTAETVAPDAALRAGVPLIARDVFIDNALDRGRIDAQLEKLEAIARKTGQAVAIGHPHDATLTALETWMPEAAARGVRFVPLSALVARTETVAARP